MESIKTGKRMQRNSAQSLGLYRMDRLQTMRVTGLVALWALTLFATSCKIEGGSEPVTRERVAVVTAQKPIKSGKEWCDVYHPKGKAPTLVLPRVASARAGQKMAPPPKDSWIWLNLWATWCGPCLREMPLISKWVTNLSRTGHPIQEWFISIDEEREVLAKFFQKHKDIAKQNSLVLVDPEALPPWLSKYGLKPDTAIPINFLVAPGMEVRCVRTGSISDSDFPIVRALVKQEKTP